MQSPVEMATGRNQYASTNSCGLIGKSKSDNADWRWACGTEGIASCWWECKSARTISCQLGRSHKIKDAHSLYPGETWTLCPLRHRTLFGEDWKWPKSPGKLMKYSQTSAKMNLTNILLRIQQLMNKNTYHIKLFKYHFKCVTHCNI